MSEFDNFKNNIFSIYAPAKLEFYESHMLSWCFTFSHWDDMLVPRVLASIVQYNKLKLFFSVGPQSPLNKGMEVPLLKSTELSRRSEP